MVGAMRLTTGEPRQAEKSQQFCSYLDMDVMHDTNGHDSE